MAVEHTGFIVKNEAGGFGIGSASVRSCSLKSGEKNLCVEQRENLVTQKSGGVRRLVAEAAARSGSWAAGR